MAIQCNCRQLLCDLAEAQARGVAYDGRLHSYDLVSLPDRGAFLKQVQLVAADLQHILCYSSGLQLLAALSFVDRPVSCSHAWVISEPLHLLHVTHAHGAVVPWHAVDDASVCVCTT